MDINLGTYKYEKSMFLDKGENVYHIHIFNNVLTEQSIFIFNINRYENAIFYRFNDLIFYLKSYCLSILDFVTFRSTIYEK